MRLALKFVLAFTLGNILLAAVYGYYAVRREVGVFQHTASVEAEALGRAMEDMLADACAAADTKACSKWSAG